MFEIPVGSVQNISHKRYVEQTIDIYNLADHFEGNKKSEWQIVPHDIGTDKLTVSDERKIVDNPNAAVTYNFDSKEKIFSRGHIGYGEFEYADSHPKNKLVLNIRARNTCARNAFLAAIDAISLKYGLTTIGLRSEEENGMKTAPIGFTVDLKNAER
jgi:hypothetical protein